MYVGMYVATGGAGRQAGRQAGRRSMKNVLGPTGRAGRKDRRAI
jgi:hypothetical protein